MTTPEPVPYDKSVFLNCPFDKQYKPLLDAVLFCVHDCGFTARIALQDLGGTVRIAKILGMIRGSRYSIHDLSRIGTPRLNMAFECGIFYGAREFGTGRQRRKDLLVLDSVRNRYKKTMSDASGLDGSAHDNDPVHAIRCVRTFLATKSDKPVPGAAFITGRYQRFVTQLPKLARRARVTTAELRSLEYLADLIGLMVEWQRENR